LNVALALISALTEFMTKRQFLHRLLSIPMGALTIVTVAGINAP